MPEKLSGNSALIEEMLRSASALHAEKKDKTKLRLRLCVACRHEYAQSELLRLTFDYKSKSIRLKGESPQDRLLCGRSAYLCPKLSCVDQCLKGNRLKIALEGRKPKNSGTKRQVAWPLESQLIHTMRSKCTEILETCQNTHSKEDS
ncbi:MAG: YlxR family protein [Candidatus Obscuribacterales bacterium]|nr:YlxR family protein [Candidatus Obscuribacterales bacterium]